MHKSYGDLIDQVEDFEKQSQIIQVMYIAYFYTVITGNQFFTSSSITNIFVTENLHKPSNIPDCLKKLCGKPALALIKRGNEFSFERGSKKRFDSDFLETHPVKVISESLRGQLDKVNSPEQRLFLEESITCYEIRTYRAAILMTWLLTMDILYEFVLRFKLAEFNTALQTNNKFKAMAIRSKEDFLEIKESEFLLFLRTAKIVTNDQKKILDEKLGIRNTASHPNAIKISESKASSFIEDLISNIVSLFQ